MHLMHACHGTLLLREDSWIYLSRIYFALILAISKSTFQYVTNWYVPRPFRNCPGWARFLHTPISEGKWRTRQICTRSSCTCWRSSQSVPQQYTFDFAQQVTLPVRSWQVGPIYFKTPHCVQLFGVCNEGLPQQIHYLLGEGETIGENGFRSHGPNTVLSLIHHYFLHYGMHEREVFLHADNCTGQNKNKTVLAYLLWRVLTSRHRHITLSFMIVGHTRCTVDGFFGLFKQTYRRSDADTMAHLVEVVERSASANSAQCYNDADKPIRFFSRDTFLGQFFTPLKGISKFHHFKMDIEQPGLVKTKRKFVRWDTDGVAAEEECHNWLGCCFWLASCCAPWWNLWRKKKVPLQAC